MDRDPRGMGASKSTACDSEGAATAGVSSIIRSTGSSHTQRSNRIFTRSSNSTGIGK
jgi:hypothetical protein